MEVPVIRDRRGTIGVIEPSGMLPFDMKRVYYLFDVATGSSRGAHAHKTLSQLLIAVAGSVVVTLTDGDSESEFLLGDPCVALHIPPGYWRSLSQFSEGCVLLVIASAEYSESDYIRQWEEFIAWRNPH